MCDHRVAADCSDRRSLFHRSADRRRVYAIRPVLPELHEDAEPLAQRPAEYSSGNDVMDYDDVVKLLTRHDLMLRDSAVEPEGVELLRRKS